MQTLGIDPGITGAIACCDGATVCAVYDVPTVAYKIGKTVKRRIDMGGFCDLVMGVAATYEIDVAVIEEVGGLPGQSASAAFTFGYTAGAMAMALVAAVVPIMRVHPAVWKKALRVPADKDGARLIASEMMPGSRHLWARVKDDGRAEAALLAQYGRRHLRSYHSETENALRGLSP